MICKIEELHLNSETSLQISPDMFYKTSDVIYADVRLTHGILKVGDVLDKWRNYRFIDDDIDTLDEKKVSLKVQQIICYDLYMDEIDTGMTARVFFSGEMNEIDLAKLNVKNWINISKTLA